MKCYIAGPMRGIEDFNFPMFFVTEQALAFCGYEVFNPARADVETGFNNKSVDGVLSAEFDVKAVVRRDIEGLLECDAIYLLPGWSKSLGAKAEHAVAVWLGLNIMGAAE